MTENKLELINEFRQKVLAASKEATKKELFKDLLNRLYANNAETKSVIDAVSSGAEASILNIPRGDKIHRGSADTLYNRIIIEFENNLKTTIKHAKEQLAGYLLGQFNSGEGYNFTLIASDFITWKVFAIDLSCIENLSTLKEHELILNEIESSSFVLKEHNAEAFYLWIDRFLFKEEQQKATLRRIEEAFGYQSKVFIEAFREMTAHFQTIKDSGEVQVSFEQWKRFLSVAYGTFDASENNFLIHTYLSVFSKMLAYTVVSNDDYIDDAEVRGIIDGSIFHQYNIGNFVDNDFYHWIKNDVSFHELKKVFRLIAQELSSFDFRNVDEDILKGVYQELIDLDTRHALGEYYTPDWLCERVVNEFEFTATDKILDPACGSGSFLRAAIDRLKKLHPEQTAERLSEQIYGIDIHPLSVQIAKTTLLLAFGKEIVKAKKPVQLNILLANTLLAPKGVGDMFGNQFAMDIDKQKLQLTTDILEDARLFDEAINICEELADQTVNKSALKSAVIANNLKIQTADDDKNQQIVESFHQIYLGFKAAKESGRDSIWKFIVQNLYKPYFLHDKFDYVIGNPPWFTYSSIRNEEYQNTLDKLAKEYSVKPEKKANYPHLEIAAIFLAYCSQYFLKKDGKLAFVLPRSFFSADHHDNTRSGKAKGFTLTEIWDLKDVAPLFRIPSCVLFARKSFVNYALPETGLNGKSFSGALSTHNQNLETAAPLLTEAEANWFYIKRGNSTAFSEGKPTAQKGTNPYKKYFKEGATIVPRVFYFVKFNQETPPDLDSDRIINIKTNPAILVDGKMPWKSFLFSGRVEGRFLFRTAIAKSILPFALYNPDLVVLPVTIDIDKAGQKQCKLHSPDDLRQLGYLHSARWFKDSENVWEKNRTEKNRNITARGYLNWRSKLTDQNINAPYLVLYNASGMNANATVVDRSKFDLNFFVDYTALQIELNNLSEAYYLSAILNSSVPNKLMKDFQARGLYGARHVYSKILDIYYPRFNAREETHLRLAELSKTAHQKTSAFLAGTPPHAELTATRLGKLRLDIKRHLAEGMRQIDELVEKLIV